jgi:HAD superfamily hydrolase (TIGR01509 family)
MKGDRSPSKSDRPLPALLFDLDGTLMDSNYEHVACWRQAFHRLDLTIPSAFLHRCIGMRDDLLIAAVAREARKKIDAKAAATLKEIHGKLFRETLRSVQPLPGANALLKLLTRRRIPWAIATGGDRPSVSRMTRALAVPRTAHVVTGDDVAKAKPEPEVFVVAAQRLGVALSDCIVVGDSVWDLLGARRAKAVGVALLCGGYGQAELTEAGAYRVYADPADLLDHLAEIGIDP